MITSDFERSRALDLSSLDPLDRRPRSAVVKEGRGFIVLCALSRGTIVVVLGATVEKRSLEDQRSLLGLVRAWDGFLYSSKTGSTPWQSQSLTRLHKTRRLA